MLLTNHALYYNVGSKGMGPSLEIGPFAKTFNEHCLVSLAYIS